MAFSWRKKVIDRAEAEEEMSMEEILSSIRKYVIDEKGPAIATTTSSHATSSPVWEEDIIELTQPLDEPETLSKKDPQLKASSVITPILSAAATKQNPSPRETTEASPTSPKVGALSPLQQTTRAANVQPIAAPPSQTPIQVKRQQHTPFQSAQYPFHPMPPLPSQPPKTVEPSKANEPLTSSHEPLVSPKTASETAQAFARLAEVALQPLAERKFVLTGDTTIEKLVTEVTKPIIQSWLDENLAPIVETMVAKEIERITRR